MTETGAHWVERLNAASIAAGPVYAVDEVFADPQVRHLDLEQVVEGDDGRPVHVLRHPVTFGDTPTSIRSGPVRGGTHTREVLAEAGYGDAEIDALLASGAASDPGLREGGSQAKRS